MARPIRTRPEPDAAGAWPEELAPELAESAASLREFLELLRLLDERGVLRFASDLLREEDRVLDVVTERVPPDDFRRAVRNLEVVVRTFRDLDPATLSALAGSVPGAVREARRAEADPAMGVLAIVRTLRDPDVNRGVRMLLGFLRGIGRPGSA